MESNKESRNETLTQLQVPVSLERFTKKIPQRYTEGEFDESRLEKVDREWQLYQKRAKKQWSFGKKAAAVTMAAAASLLLFVGSGFVSPAMAKMMAKIPSLSAIYDRFDGNVSDHIEKDLKEAGYPVKAVQEHVGGKKEGVHIFLDASEANIKKMEPGVEKIGYKIIRSNKYKGTKTEDYYVRVRKYIEPSEKWKKEQEQIDKETTEVFAIVEQVLKTKGYDFSNGFGGGPDMVELEFPSTESKEKIVEIKKSVEEALRAAGIDSVEVKHRTFNLEKRQQYNRWGNAIAAIGRELMTYKKYNVKMVSHVSKDGVFYIHIKMTLSSKDPDAEERANDIYSMIEDFIHTDDVWEKVKNDPYEITITSKDKKTLFEKKVN